MGRPTAGSSLKHQDVLICLSNNSYEWGVDKRVDDPVNLIINKFKVGRATAMTHLRDLAARGAITLDYASNRGTSIETARIKKTEIPRRIHEYSNTERLIASLRSYQTTSVREPGKRVVNAAFFHEVIGKADIVLTMLYPMLQEFKERGWIEIRYDPYKIDVILYVVITDQFPKNP